MVQKLDPSELVTLKELLMANSMEIDTVTNLLINRGIFTEQELYLKLIEVRSEYQNKTDD